MKLSIIVPVYNTDTSILERCLMSILKLKGFKYEVLLINDGSKNNYSKKYELLIKKINSNMIKYYCKENGGVSSARNFGIEKSNGKYIMFVDSDDIIYPSNFDAKDLLLNYDVIIYNMIYIANTEYKKKELPGSSRNISVQKALEYYLENKLNSPCSKLYKKDYLIDKKIKFMTDLIQGEDAIFNSDIINSGACMYYKDTYIYGYYFDIATSNNRWKNNPDQMFKNYCFLLSKKYSIIEKLDKSTKENQIEAMIESFVSNAFSVSLDLVSEKQKYTSVINKFSDIVKQIDIKKYNFNYKIKIKFFLLKNRNICLMIFVSKIREVYLKYLKKTYN